MFPWLSEGPEWWGRPGGEVPGAKPLGPHTHPWMLALLVEDRSQSHVLEGHVGTECLSAPLGQAGLPTLRLGGRSHSGSHEAGCLVPGRVGLGARQGLGLLGLWKASKGEGGGGGGDIWRQKFSQAWWLPFLAIPRRRHEGTGLSPGVCIQAVCLGPSARPEEHPKEPQ